MRSASAKRNGLSEDAIDDGIENYENSDRFSAKQKLILRYSELMATEPEKIDAAFYAELKAIFSLAEIVEIGTFIAFNLGFHTFFGTLDFYPMFDKEGNLVSQEESRRVYGDVPRSHAAPSEAISAS